VELATGPRQPCRRLNRRLHQRLRIAELTASIKAHGLLQNLQVRENASGKFEVVAEMRRLKALKLLAQEKASHTVVCEMAN